MSTISGAASVAMLDRGFAEFMRGRELTPEQTDDARLAFSWGWIYATQFATHYVADPQRASDWQPSPRAPSDTSKPGPR